MKTMSRWLCLTVVFAGLIGLSSQPIARAAEDDVGDKEMGERLQRLERQVHQLAEQQQQFMQRVGGALEQHGQQPGSPRPEMEGQRPPMTPRFEPQGQHSPGPPPPAPMAGSGTQCGPRKHGCRGAARVLGLIILAVIIVNILLAVWVATDIRKRGEGHSIFIVLALIAGIPATILYALVRIGDRRT